MKPRTKEKQYEECLTVAETAGIASLGLMTNQVWHDDPRRLAFVLARYKFVAKMLAGAEAVLEVGCGDAFGARIVQQDVGSLTVVDIDPLFIADIEKRADPRWSLKAAVHDMLSGPFAGPFDAIYSLDVLEHIAELEEDAFLGNAAASLGPHGVMIVGMPSLASQAHASPQSRIGHVNCRNAPDLKASLARHFRNVFVFSMNDEVVHTGFWPMAHYYLALCCGPKGA
ncbi:MAG: class I SAM-dependent methyltransferase [Alphaproteobacteria bacterium]|nr:class I SAM-dependent methyltransferase [Alphaproteobacteria bacterium]